jgi:hypothetical protein
MSELDFGLELLGWNDDGLGTVGRRGWAVSAIERLGLTYDPASGRVGFPIRDAALVELGEALYLPDPDARNGRPKLEQPSGVPRQLFPPPETIPNDVEQLVLCEGESDVVAAWSAGFAAVGVPGTNGWRAEYAARFAGRRWTLYTAFDCDVVGRQAAGIVVDSLVEHGVDARLVDLAEHREDGYDLTDFLLEHTPDEFGFLLDVAEPEPLPQAEAAAEPTRLIVRTAPEMVALPEPPDHYRLLGPLLYRGSRTVIVGDTGHGKTSFALQMLGAALKGETMLEHEGAGVGPALIVDLEQGIRSIKRGLRESNLADREDVLYVSAPDGLALDRDPADFAALDDVLAEYRPAMLLLDPYYKAHRADDPNAERPIIDLMRRLDALRATYEFALILPAHPRKDVAGREGARKLTIHDVAGSGAATRGAELVLGLERLGHGYARLRYLKDRDGDLPVGEAVTLLYSREDGFRLDPRDKTSDESLEQAILEACRTWATVKEWRVELGVREAQARRMLEALAERGQVAYQVGRPGAPTAKLYSSDPDDRDRPGSGDQLRLAPEGDPGDPPSLIGEGVTGSPDEPGDEWDYPA